MKGRPEHVERNRAIMNMLHRGQSWSSIVKATGCSRSTLSKLAKRPPTEGPRQGCGPHPGRDLAIAGRR